MGDGETWPRSTACTRDPHVHYSRVESTLTRPQLRHVCAWSPTFATYALPRVQIPFRLDLVLLNSIAHVNVGACLLVVDDPPASPLACPALCRRAEASPGDMLMAQTLADHPLHVVAHPSPAHPQRQDPCIPRPALRRRIVEQLAHTRNLQTTPCGAPPLGQRRGHGRTTRAHASHTPMQHPHAQHAHARTVPTRTHSTRTHARQPRDMRMPRTSRQTVVLVERTLVRDDER
jgi:hypothetical protein